MGLSRLTIRWLCVIAGTACLLVLLKFIAPPPTRGVGSFDQPFVIESSKPIRRVAYCAATVRETDRRRAEKTADFRLFEGGQEAARQADGRYSAHIMFTTESDGARWSKVYYYPQLAVLVEFADGSRRCRVVDMPGDRGRTEIVVRLDENARRTP